MAAKKKSGRGGPREGAGRPALPPEEIRRSITVRLLEPTIVALDTAAEAAGVTRTGWLEESARAHLGRVIERYEVLDFYGAVTDPDLYAALLERGWVLAEGPTWRRKLPDDYDPERDYERMVQDLLLFFAEYQLRAGRRPEADYGIDEVAVARRRKRRIG